MTEGFARIGEAPISQLRFTAAQHGPWCIDAVMEDDLAVGSGVTVQFGQMELVGTVAPQSGTFGQRRSVRIVAGANGWGKFLRPHAYANDAGVAALLVAQDAAREAGETLGSFEPEAARLGPHFARQAGIASRTLEQVIGSVGWWVDSAGVTQVGIRPASQPTDDTYEVLHHDPRTQVVTLAVDDPTSISVGSILTERLDSALTVRELEYTMENNKLRARAWCGGTPTTRGNLAGLIERIITQVSNRRLLGKWRYRVVELAGDRVNLQIVRKAGGMPDVLRVPHWPGMPGMESEPTLGAVVLVEFLDGGDPSLPAITGYAGKGEPGFQPQSMEIFSGGKEVARNGDPVEVALPPATFSGTINGAPATGIVQWIFKAQGTIKGGSGKLKIG